MSDKKYVVPEEGLKAAILYSGYVEPSAQAVVEKKARELLLCFVRWQDNRIASMHSRLDNAPEAAEEGYRIGYSDAKEEVRRMYLALESEVPEDVQAFWNVQPDAFARKQILAAYWLGKASR